MIGHSLADGSGRDTYVLPCPLVLLVKERASGAMLLFVLSRLL